MVEVTKSKVEVLTAIRTAYPCVFFGINAQQVTAGMNEIKLEDFESYVRVTSPSFPGQSRRVYNAGILERTYKTPQAAEDK